MGCTLSRTQAALLAIRRELERRAAYLDGSDGLVQLSVTVKFTAGTGQVRGVVVQDEHVESRPAAPARVAARDSVVVSADDIAAMLTR